VNASPARFAMAWLVSLGAACASAPIRYYTLTPPSDVSQRAPPTPSPIEVRFVHIPPQLNHFGLMVRTGPAETTLLENERWASPMANEIKDALRLQLQRRLGGLNGLRPPKLVLDIDVQRLEAELGRYAVLEASWSVNLSGAGPPPGGARVANCAFRAEEAIHGGYAGMVEGYQREIAALADAIAAALVNPAKDIGAVCATD
jgi:uncharacterized protein